ncbi:MAG: RloB family protein [Nannocystaceae bacterium]
MAGLERMEPRRRGRRGRRAYASRALRKRFLIVCEGAVTEVAYFQAFPISREVRVVVHGEGKNTTSLVAAAVQQADVAIDEEEPFDEVWVVYDQDDFGSQKFNQADSDIRELGARRREQWQAAWSNQAFELWYVLHFQFIDSKLHRHLLNRKLGELLREAGHRSGYEKNDLRMYTALLPRQPTAISHARRLVRKHELATHVTPASQDPCTMVFALVEALNAEIP